MSKRKEKFDPNQLQFDFSFEERVDAYVKKRMELSDAMAELPKPKDAVSEFELCVLISSAAGQMIRRSGYSMEQIVDEMNAYFGRTAKGAEEDPPECRKPLTIHMLYNYLNKPDRYPMQGYFIMALQHICGELAVTQVMVEAEGGNVVTAEETDMLTLGKLEATMSEMNRLRKKLKMGRRS